MESKGGKKTKQKVGPKAKEKSGEPILTPFLGVPKDLLDPLLTDVVKGNVTLQNAHKTAYAIKAEARMGSYINNLLRKEAVDREEDPEEAHTYEEVVSDPVKNSLLAQFKSKSNVFSCLFCLFFR
jgi:hypothetical protein